MDYSLSLWPFWCVNVLNFHWMDKNICSEDKSKTYGKFTWASASMPSVCFEWRDVEHWWTELWVRHWRYSQQKLKFFFRTFQVPTQASANQIPLLKYPRAKASQSCSCNSRKVKRLSIVTITIKLFCFLDSRCRYWYLGKQGGWWPI